MCNCICYEQDNNINDISDDFKEILMKHNTLLTSDDITYMWDQFKTSYTTISNKCFFCKNFISTSNKKSSILEELASSPTLFTNDDYGEQWEYVFFLYF